MNFRTLLVFISFFTGTCVFASPSELTYQGRIVKTDGQPLENSNVSFIFQILNPAGSCLLYQEQVTGINMDGSKGVFDVPIGKGSVQFPLSGTASVLDAFNNSTTFTCGACSGSGGSYTCSNGSSTYLGVPGDTRLLRVSFYDGSGWKRISPDNVIRSVPFAGYALAAQKLGTNVAADFVTKLGLPNCAAGTFLTWNSTTSTMTCAGVVGAGGGTVTGVTSSDSYISVADPNNAPILTLNVGQVANTVAAGNDPRFTNSRPPNGSAGGDLTGSYPNPTLANISGLTAGTYGSATAIPVINVDAKGRVTSVTTSTVSTSGITALTGEVTASGTGSVAATIAANAVTSAKILDATIVGADMDFTGVNTATSSFVMKDSTGKFSNFACSTAGHIPTWTVTGFACQAPASVTETDPKVTSATTNRLSKWNGTALIDSAVHESSGNVGIGTTSPAGKLEVSSGASGDSKLYITSDTDNNDETDNPYLIFRQDGGYDEAAIWVGGANNNLNISSSDTGSEGIFFRTDMVDNNYENAPVRMLIGSNGKVGIGTTSPDDMLHISAPPNEKARARFSSWGGAYHRHYSIGTDGSNSSTSAPYFDFSIRDEDAGLDRLTIAWSSGYVGIGRTDPQAKLDVDGGIHATEICDETGANCKDISTGWGSGASSLAGDVTGAFGTTSVDAIKGKSVVPVAYATGQVLRYDGTNWVNALLDINTLVPAQTGNANKILQTNGTSVSWVDAPATGITALTGEVTASGTGSVATTIAANAVTSAKILDATIVAADMDFTGVNAATSGFVMKDSTGKFSNFVCSTVGHVPTWTASGFACQASGSVTETDPKVASATTGRLSKWNGTALVDSVIHENSGNIGIGTASPANLLHIEKNQNADTYMVVKNTTNGTASEVGIAISSDVGDAGYLWSGSSSFATVSAAQTRLLLSATTNTLGLSLGADGAGDVRIYTGNDLLPMVDPNTKRQI